MESNGLHLKCLKKNSKLPSKNILLFDIPINIVGECSFPFLFTKMDIISHLNFANLKSEN